MGERTATARLSRLLALVPYVLTHQGVSFAEAAREFDITESQLKDDLNLIFVSGLPGYTPLELIDVVMDHDTIHIRNADVIAKPMRLHPDEALSLLLGLALLEPFSPAEVSALKTKISEAALTPVTDIAERFAVVGEHSEVGILIHDALRRGRRLLIEYYVPNRDEVTQREIDPLRIDIIDGHTYVAAYCRSAESQRHFRLDRILEAKIVDRPISPPPDIQVEQLFATDVDQRVEIELQPSARWLIDYLSAEVISQDPLIISAPMSQPEFFVRLGLSMATSITIKAPKMVRQSIAERARQAL